MILKDKGMTLVELMIAIAVSGIIIVLISSTYSFYSKVSVQQEKFIEANQKARFAMYIMERDFLMAGYEPDPTNPSGADFDNPGTTSVGIESVVFEDDNIDNDGDGVIDEINEIETIRYTFNNGTLLRQDSLSQDTDGDGTIDPEPLCRDVENIEFLYFDEDGNATADASSVRSVGISLLVRSRTRAVGYTDSKTYETLSGAKWGPFNDNFKRSFLTTRIYCRNLSD